MRMPFTEFITNGDLKFIIAFIVFSAVAIYNFTKKIQVRNKTENQSLIKYYNSKINSAAFWILISSLLSLLLGLIHSFYFIGKAGGIAPNLIFQGVSYILITPVLGVCLFMICKIFKGIMNLKISKT
ncbi:hypothetical protein MWU50_15090 [Flavobacteriaceae bacterium S0862]|nr:hypothetical protein [Flavobacteriaceae bacterium S0862]